MMWVVQVEAAFLLACLGPQHHQDDSVRDQKEEEPVEDQHPTVGDHKELQEGGGHVGKSQHLWNVTVEVI